MFKYTVKRQLKQLPGNVTVFAAVQKDLDRAVEIRVLNHFVKTDSDEYLRFEREFKTIARLDHPNIIKVFDWGIANDKIYYVAEMKPAKGLDDLLKQGQAKFTVQEVLDIGRQLASAIAYLHKNNIVHRDITFSSINYQKEKKAAYIAHFSLVKNLNLEDLTARGVSHFQSLQLTPEKVLGVTMDHRVDIFLFGALLYQLATEKNPLASEGEELSLATAEAFDFQAPSKIKAHVPESLDEIILKCLAKNPDDRFQSAKDLEDSLNKVFEDNKMKTKRESTTRMKAVDEKSAEKASSSDSAARSSSGSAARSSSGSAARSSSGSAARSSSASASAKPNSKPAISDDDENEFLETLKELDPKLLIGGASIIVILFLAMLALLLL